MIRAFVIILATLVLFKGLLVAEGKPISFNSDTLLAMLIYGAMFGSPQIYWALRVRSMASVRQLSFASSAVVLYFILYAYFGFFPWQEPRVWGSEHWEVPAAFIVEWAVAGSLGYLYTRAGATVNE